MDWMEPGKIVKCDLLVKVSERGGSPYLVPNGKTVMVRILEVFRGELGEVTAVRVQTLNAARRIETVEPRYLHGFAPIPATEPRPARPTKRSRRERKAGRDGS